LFFVLPAYPLPAAMQLLQLESKIRWPGSFPYCQAAWTWERKYRIKKDVCSCEPGELGNGKSYSKKVITIR